MKKPESISIYGRRWFSRTYGNTYFTVAIYVDNELVHQSDREYGYGDYYAQAAGEWLAENGYIVPKKYDHGGQEALWLYCRNNDIKFTNEVADVKRQRDL